MNQIVTPPQTVTDAGLSFNYALWTAGTVVTLVNSPWDVDYRNVVKPGFNLDSWIGSRPNKHVVQNMKHMRLNQPIRISTPFEVAAQYNYIRATNPAQPVSGSLPSTYYYFIKSVEYGAPNTTILNIQLDVWATFINTISFTRAYLNRGHYGIANSRQMEQQGRRYLTVAEGMDLGGELEIAHVWKHEIASAVGDSPQNVSYSIMVTSSSDLEADQGADGNVKVVTASGSPMENLPNGGAIYFFESNQRLISYLANTRNKSWVTQSITSILAIPTLSSMDMELETIELDGVEAFKPGWGTIPQSDVELVDDWTTSLGLPTRYANLHKFKVFPYAAIELTTANGQPLLMKPESMYTKKIDVTLMFHLNPGSGRVTIIPKHYNAGAGVNTSSNNWGYIHDGGEWLDFATSISNFPSFTTMNNSYAAYMQNNKNNIAYQYKSASWAQQRAMAGASTAYGQATSGMNLTGDLATNQVQLTAAQAAAQNAAIAQRGGVGMAQGALGAVGTGMSSGPVAGVMGGVSSVGGSFANAMIDTGLNNANAANQMLATAQGARATQDNQGYNRDTNQQLAAVYASGDYANAIGGIQAATQDATMLQPTTSGQIGGESFNLAKIGWNVFAILKRIAGNAQSEIGEYWLRYGYKVNRWVEIPESLLVCSNFTYWQTLDTQIFSESCPEEYRQTIRGIMEKGVTVWNNPDQIGRLDPATNPPLEGISY